MAVLKRRTTRGRDTLKSAEEIMEILDAYDLTGSLRDAAELAGCSHHTVKRYVTARDQAGTPPQGPAKRAQVIDAYLDKVNRPGFFAAPMRVAALG